MMIIAKRTAIGKCSCRFASLTGYSREYQINEPLHHTQLILEWETIVALYTGIVRLEYITQLQ